MIDLQAIFNQAAVDYFDVAYATADTIHNNVNLGLLPPGTPEQLMLNLNNGVNVTKEGIPLFHLVARRANTDNSISPMAFGRAIQAALDTTCYGCCCNRLSVVGVKFVGSYVLLTLTWGCW